VTNPERVNESYLFMGMGNLTVLVASLSVSITVTATGCNFNDFLTALCYSHPLHNIKGVMAGKATLANKRNDNE
jgi:hypothetical protein